MYTIYKITAFILSNQTLCGKSNGMLPPLGEAGNIPLGICLLRNVKCVDSLLFVSKHAEGMSLRYDANLTHTRVGINLLSLL